ncbi:14020_t:CDS:1, partial [Cetraspora pellucida]
VVNVYYGFRLFNIYWTTIGLDYLSPATDSPMDWTGLEHVFQWTGLTQ